MKKVIIVGAGISGLSAGIYALQSGFDATIYESHTIPGVGPSNFCARIPIRCFKKIHKFKGAVRSICFL